ncbi:MAG: hypothetical protein OXT03_05065 [Alphaproteobacteria bacterium]|nr:hypothetical protein [Alphaproteobacteria bacterium]
MAKKFRHSASFGKRIEYWIVGLLLEEGFDVFVPVVDDQAIDAIIRNRDGKIIDLQIKARSKSKTKIGNGAIFAALNHPKLRKNYYFLFYAERLNKIWLMSSKDFIAEAVQNKSGKTKGRRTIKFNGKRNEKEYPREKFEKYCITKEDGTHDFSRIKKILEKL